MKKIVILGSTGSIGTQSVDVIKTHHDLFKVVGLSANRNYKLLAEQANILKPEMVVIADEKYKEQLKALLNFPCEILSGDEGLRILAAFQGVDVVINSLVGIAGLLPTVSAIKAGNTVALANKETMVTAGELIVELSKLRGVPILPIDSEHSAIFQCIQKASSNEVKSIILTASGGPFRGYNREMLKKVKVSDALKHPTWNMGNKVTIDSASLMNKGLEVIEAHWFFNVCYDDIKVVIHPESIIHSMVEFVDGAIIAQLGVPDMRLPIQYALTYPERIDSNVKELDIIGKTLNFYKPDIDTFKCLKLAYDAGRSGGTYTTVLNSANEVCVDLFTKGVIGFTDIPDIIEKMLQMHKPIYKPQFEDIIYIDSQVREVIKKMVVD